MRSTDEARREQPGALATWWRAAPSRRDGTGSNGTATILVVGFNWLEALIRFLGGRDGDLIFGQLPLAYVFQALDLAMICLFGCMGLKEAYEVLR